MMLTPFLIVVARPVAERLSSYLGVSEISLLPPEQAAIAELREHAIIVDYGLSGRHLARVLRHLGTYWALPLTPDRTTLVE